MELSAPWYREDEFFIIGIAADYWEALEVTRQIVEELYQNTGGFDLTGYLNGRPLRRSHRDDPAQGMSIILFILKLLGILVLILLGLVLGVLLLILLVPVRYRIEGSYYEQLKGKARITWLLHIVSVTAAFEDEFSVGIRLFGFRLFKPVEESRDYR